MPCRQYKKIDRQPNPAFESFITPGFSLELEALRDLLLSAEDPSLIAEERKLVAPYKEPPVEVNIFAKRRSARAHRVNGGRRKEARQKAQPE